eukprot:CAMPEP_0172819300 /NCGR_PEP_ID=MMETSP1075-20121228/14502_1 /TAXON_ID=2916 /ORGANISM="Ceratium fusus, Strain PA161109" /LENGTH=516 /DNA_ID=CAMNT_0013659801 /DNA_START=62 /DNA_END=1612 /DNA_ORIENTATION=+
MVLDPNCAFVLLGLNSEPKPLTHWRMTPAEAMELLEFIELNMDRLMPSWINAGGRVSLQVLLTFTSNEDCRETLRNLPASVHGLLLRELVVDAFSSFDEEEGGYMDKSSWVRFTKRLHELYLFYLQSVALAGSRTFFGRGQPWNNAGSPADVASEYAWGCPERLLLEAGEGLLAMHRSGTRDDSVDDITELLRPDSRDEFPVIKLPTFQLGIDRDCRRHGRGPIPPGWWQDFVYYSANNHPLHGIFSCDLLGKALPLERAAIELSTCGLSLAFSVGITMFAENCLNLGKGDASASPSSPAPLLRRSLALGIVLVTLPSIAIWHCVYKLFMMPRFSKLNEAFASDAEIIKAWRFRACGEAVAYLLVALGIAAVIWRVYATPEVMWDDLTLIILARLQAYACEWILMILVTFNPIVAWGQADPNGPLCVGDMLGLGRWRLEKQQFQVSCLRALQSGHSANNVRSVLQAATVTKASKGNEGEQRRFRTSSNREGCQGCDVESLFKIMPLAIMKGNSPTQ